MSVERDFFEHYVEALERRTAALFVGAGLSAAADFPDWKTLLSGVAEEIELDVKQESDLPAVAQFYLNRVASSRGRIADLVGRTFRRSVPIPDNHRILARLPYRHVWTTNYDHLVERAWELSGKRMDIKSRNANLTSSDPEADAILYKMHGTADHPDDIVLSRDDYELYPTKRPGFLQILGSDLITSTFLFLGLSFTDPNLSYLMGTLRASFQNVPRQHFTIMKRPAGEYAGKRFRLFTDDLQRYGIRTLMVGEYADITKVLSELEQRCAQTNVFVSGSYPEEGGDPEERGFIGRVARVVGRLLARRGLTLVSGFGRVVGSQVVAGAVNELYQNSRARNVERIMIRPTRDLSLEGLTLEQSKRRAREDTISLSGIMIVIAGVRKGSPSSPGVLEDSPGVLEEFEIATPAEEAGAPDRGHRPRRQADLRADAGQPRGLSAEGDPRRALPKAGAGGSLGFGH
jgi:hypothetical protein